MAKRRIGKLESFSPKELLFPEEVEEGSRHRQRGKKDDGGGNGDGNGGGTASGDIDGDGSVGGADLTALLGSWGTADPAADLNGDGVVDGADLTILLSSWGNSTRETKRIGKKPEPSFQGVQTSLTPIDSNVVNENEKKMRRIGLQKNKKTGRATGFSTGPGGGSGGGGTPI